MELGEPHLQAPPRSRGCVAVSESRSQVDEPAVGVLANLVELDRTLQRSDGRLMPLISDAKLGQTNARVERAGVKVFPYRLDPLEQGRLGFLNDQLDWPA